jgi:hypothetical protein
MPIVQAGKQFTADDLSRTAGELASQLRDLLQDGNDFRIQLESFPDADLITLGLTQEQINAIKGFFVGDLPTLYNAFAASTWVKQLLGLGV